MTMHFGKGRSMGHLNRKTQGLSSAATVTAAWNPADKNGTWTLSASNLRAASTSSSGVTSVRGNTPRTTGKWYWEFVQNAGTPFVGLATLSQTLTTASTSANTAGWYQPTTNVGGWVNNAWGGLVLAQSWRSPHGAQLRLTSMREKSGFVHHRAGGTATRRQERAATASLTWPVWRSIHI